MTYPRQVDRSNAVWSLLPTAKFVDRGTHIEWMSDNEAGTVTCLLYTSPSPRD